MKYIAILLAPLLLAACDSNEVTQDQPTTEETPNRDECKNLPEGTECP